MSHEQDLATRERRVHLMAEAEELLRKSLSKLHMAQLKTRDWDRLLEEMRDCLQGMRVLGR